MRLELAEFPVSKVQFGEQTAYDNGTLTINKQEILDLVRQDSKIASADLDFAAPGEKTRIINGRDAVEPRAKVSGPGGVFPGVINPIETVGSGVTNRLSGVSVIAIADYNSAVSSGSGGKNTAILDMWGPGAQMTPFGSIINVTLIFKLVDGVSEWEAHCAIQTAECRVAQRLAQTTINQKASKSEIFDTSQITPSLPKIVYIAGCLSEWHNPHSGTGIYGLPIRESMPFLLHPNEFLDGAMTVDARRGHGQRITTWFWMNHPIILGLLREHGKRLNFIGVIAQRTRFESEFGKHVTANVTSQMARLLGADGAVVTRMSESGANLIDVVLTIQACEKKGIKTVFVTPEYGGPDGTEPPLVFCTPEASAIVSTGATQRGFVLPAPSKVIGLDHGMVSLYPGDPPFSPWDELVREQKRDIYGGPDWTGIMDYTNKDY